MEVLIPWLTPALLIALFMWLRREIGKLRRDIREQRRDLSARIDTLTKGVNKHFSEVHRELGDRTRFAGWLADRAERRYQKN